MNYAFPKVTSMIVMFFFLTGPRAPLCVCVKEECAIQRVLVYPCQRRLQEVEVSLNKRAVHNLRNTKINDKISKPIFRISWANFCTKKVSRVGISLTFPNFCPRNLQKKVLLLAFMLRHLVFFAFIR